MRWTRTLAACAAAIVACTLIAGCSSTSSNTERGAQARALQRADRSIARGRARSIARARRRRLVAQRERRMALARRRARPAVAAKPALGPNPAILRTAGVSPTNLCGKVGPRGRGAARRQARRAAQRRRRQALYYLNLSCK